MSDKRIKGSKPPSKSNVWLVRAGRHGEDEATALEEGLAIIGFSMIPDLSGVRTSQEVLERVKKALPGENENRIRNFAAQLGAFVLQMREDDIVALPLKTTGQIALGRLTGPYEYRQVEGVKRHARSVRWIRTAVQRSDFQQDLLYSLGAFLTVCKISRNEAASRFAIVLDGKQDPGPPEAEQPAQVDKAGIMSPAPVEAEEAPTDIAQVAQGQILDYIAKRFPRHEFARLIDTILQAEGFVTQRSTPGPDGGVDILAAQGTLGFDGPHLCVQVKSSSKPEDVNTLRALKGTMQMFNAHQGLLVAWGGFTQPVQREARQSFFSVRLWSATDVLDAIYRVYDRLPEEIQAELPLKRVWTLVLDETGE